MQALVIPKSRGEELLEFSDSIGIFKNGVSHRVEYITRGFESYFPKNLYQICEISPGRYAVERKNKRFIFQMYSDQEMQNHAERYFYPALSDGQEGGKRPEGYWMHPPEYISWGGYFIGENGEKILTNPFI